MTLACEDAYSKLVEVVTVADVSDVDRVGNSLLQIGKPRFGYGFWVMGYGLWILIGFTFGYGVSTALRTVLWPTPFLTRPKASRSGWLFQSTIPSKVTIAEKA